MRIWLINRFDKSLIGLLVCTSWKAILHDLIRVLRSAFEGDFQVLGIFSGRSQVGFTKSNDVVDLPYAEDAYATRQLDTDHYYIF